MTHESHYFRSVNGEVEKLPFTCAHWNESFLPQFRVWGPKDEPHVVPRSEALALVNRWNAQQQTYKGGWRVSYWIAP